MMFTNHKNKILIISGPSGVGKSTICKRIFNNKNLNLVPSISFTTRPIRNGEINGVDYNFVSVDEFKNMIVHDDLIEYIKFQDNYYGTSKNQCLKVLNDSNHHLILEIDVIGAEAFKNQFEKVVSIFLIPNSFETLQNRIKKRGAETPEQITARMHKATSEMMEKSKYDYQVINNDLDATVEQVIRIIKQEIG